MRVLHLEDSAADAELIAGTLNAAWPHCRIRRAATREEFQDALETDVFELILSDYTLGGYDGLSALELARTRCPEKPFIFISGTIGEERAIEALKRGATDYVIKDRPTRLVPAIRQALSRADEAREHRQTEDALRENRERFRQITENVADLIVMLDASGRCLYRNPAYHAAVERLEGSGGEAELLTDVFPADRAIVQALVRETLRSGSSERAEYRLVSASGAVRFVDAQASAVRDRVGTVTQVLLVARDITERRAAEQRLREQAALLDLAQDAIIVRDLDDRITFWNQGAARLYGWNATVALGRPARELWEEDETQLETARRQAIFRGEWLGQMRHHTRHGAQLVVQSRWTLLRDPAGTPTGFLVLNTDITEKRRMEAQLLRLQRVESIGLLASGVAHDINNVLAPILLSAELLKPIVPAGEGRHLLAAIDQGARHGSALMQQLLAFARGTAGVHTRLALRSLLDDFTGFLAQTFPRTIKVSLCLANEPRPVRGDATQLKQVLMNLCLNARDAMPDGGRITLTLANADLDEPLARGLGGLRPGPYVLITVADNGAGIPPALIDKVFDPFFTTKELGKGSGLGLAAVRGIVKGHDGAIALESEPGRGTTVCVYLPAITHDSAPPMVATRDRPGGGKTLLVVDDEPTVLDVLAALLSAHGYRVLKARSGAEALEVFAAHPTEVTLVLTDITMSGIDGIELIRRLRTRAPQLPILAMSGMAGAGCYEDQVGAFGVPLLAKPLMRDNLFAAIDAALTPCPEGGENVRVSDR